MRILIVTPVARGSRMGNRITALRWSRILRGLGHRTTIATEYQRQQFDLMIALHARKSALSIQRCHADHSGLPLVVALTGTDLYRDLGRSRAAQASLAYASRTVLLQPAGIAEIPAAWRSKCRVIYQSAIPARSREPLKRGFEVVVAGHLRPVKDPFRAAFAVRNLPAESRLRVTHVGAALTNHMLRQAEAEMSRNPRYHWVGEVPHWRSRQLIARARLLVLSSKMEGGASVIAEALVNQTPVIASQVSGNRGMLGDDYPGLYHYGKTNELKQLLLRFETDSSFAKALDRAAARRAAQHAPAKERRSWQQLLAELC